MMSKLKKLIKRSKNNYKKLEESQIMLGSYLCELLKEIIPEIRFQVGDYDMGLEYIRLEVPYESPRYRLKYPVEEQEKKFIYLDVDMMLSKGGIKPFPIYIDDCVVGVSKEEREKIEEIIKKELEDE